jgi:DNA-binding LytR/AlgR family response regulator
MNTGMPRAACTAIIADDEDLPRSDLRRALARLWPELEIVAECEHGTEALEAIESLRPAIAFLDIRMPGLTGIDVAHAASGCCHVVFTTAYDHYAVDAFQAGALDYLLKPFGNDRLAQTVARLRERIATPAPDLLSTLQAIEQEMRTRQSVQRLRWISANAGDTIKIFPIDDILFFEADDKYTRVVTADDEAHIRMTLKELLAGLDPDRFWQIHRGLIVQADRIARVRRDELGRHVVELRGRDEQLRASQAYAWRFKAM